MLFPNSTLSSLIIIPFPQTRHPQYCHDIHNDPPSIGACGQYCDRPIVDDVHKREERAWQFRKGLMRELVQSLSILDGEIMGRFRCTLGVTRAKCADRLRFIVLRRWRWRGTSALTLGIVIGLWRDLMERRAMVLSFLWRSGGFIRSEFEEATGKEHVWDLPAACLLTSVWCMLSDYAARIWDEPVMFTSPSAPFANRYTKIIGHYEMILSIATRRSLQELRIISRMTRRMDHRGRSNKHRCLLSAAVTCPTAVSALVLAPILAPILTIVRTAVWWSVLMTIAVVLWTTLSTGALMRIADPVPGFRRKARRRAIDARKRRKGTHRQECGRSGRTPQ
ncbi:hypothetical protein WOLCODRAFT_20260 [Wolfiporia cocos MD-104 SS10]|uniref:Uncharacterized protein n=1 Tax=Wolfiporia cocos (strain MD-104) TaxID=742152 RepID=A0A2H3J877_WOLCO|nr:hypothetical protein WOLCODRAFT_20260 [Wolfiporia cocos MD-104 SS10]